VPNGPDVTAEQIDDLSTLLMDHPFAPEQPLLHTIDHSVTTGAAQAQARAVAAELHRAGVQPDQAVAVQLPNGPDVVIAMVGIWLAGAVFVPVNPRLPDAEIEGVLGPTGPAAIIGPEGIRSLPGARTYAPGTAFILWTSGTTGRPKPILHTHHGYGELLDRVLTPLRSGNAPSTRAPSPNLIPVSLALKPASTTSCSASGPVRPW
jgi:acyl-CoA synthetase (AMP-forming)/AMP-acid ligase II